MLVQVNEKRAIQPQPRNGCIFSSPLKVGRLFTFVTFFLPAATCSNAALLRFFFFSSRRTRFHGQEPKILQEWLSTNKQPKEKKKVPEASHFFGLQDLSRATPSQSPALPQ